MDATTATAPKTYPATCKCGFDKNHGLIRPECEYSFMGSLLLVFAGAGARPRKVTLICPRCKTVLDVITDPKQLLKYH